MFFAVGMRFYAGAMLLLVCHAFYKALLFLTAGNVLHGLRDEQDMRRMGGLRHDMPLSTVWFAIGALSLAGIPPLAGFWGKLYVFIAAVEARLFWPAILGVLASVVASYYYLRIVKVMYFDEGTEALDPTAFSVNRVVAFAAAVLVAVFSLAPQPLSVVAAAAAKGLFP